MFHFKLSALLWSFVDFHRRGTIRINFANKVNHSKAAFCDQFYNAVVVDDIKWFDLWGTATHASRAITRKGVGSGMGWEGVDGIGVG
jgi:hypothetical protein